MLSHRGKNYVYFIIVIDMKVIIVAPKANKIVVIGFVNLVLMFSFCWCCYSCCFQ